MAMLRYARYVVGGLQTQRRNAFKVTHGDNGASRAPACAALRKELKSFATSYWQNAPPPRGRACFLRAAVPMSQVASLRARACMAPGALMVCTHMFARVGVWPQYGSLGMHVSLRACERAGATDGTQMEHQFMRRSSKSRPRRNATHASGAHRASASVEVPPAAPCEALPRPTPADGWSGFHQHFRTWVLQR
jgi:hypothetical protein